MTIQSVLILLPSVLSGILLAHLIWPDGKIKSILLKLFLGIGLGLGVNSQLFFIYLLLFGRQSGYLIVQLLELIVLAILVFNLEKSRPTRLEKLQPPKPLQVIFLASIVGLVILSSAIFATVTIRKPYGAWDAWMIYNRTARFIFRGEEHWADAFSPELDWSFHADYPPLIALNIVPGWDVLGEETIRVPMAVGSAFLFGAAGLLFASVYHQKTLGQAVLALGALFGVSNYISMGAGQVADVPLSFFILATGILIYLHSIKKEKGLLILAGLSAGLGAWTKNEGILFVLISLFAFLLIYRQNLKGTFSWYLLGLAFPILIGAYFKIALAPPGDLLVDIPSQLRQFLELDRHRYLLSEFVRDFGLWGNWILLILYLLVFGVHIKEETAIAVKACSLMFFMQLVGYYGVFIITPHPFEWHVEALSRVLLQVIPLFFFLVFSVARPPETAFQSR